ncbi:AAA family ATPase [Candidatus Electronema sp. PJ]|uniref:ExeA family protein n=1 Tax=Candidatus Electronema sp. PJ TaxID=3401572 RepID=UPI003AA8396B
MHLEYFGLAKPPFAAEPDTDIFFQEADRTSLLRRIYAELKSGSPVIRLIGEEGTGKTLLCLLLSRLLPAEFQVACLPNPAGSFDELLRVACEQFGLQPEADMPGWLHGQLEQCQAQGKKFLLIIDQAEKMFPAALERLLRAVFAVAEKKTLHVILAGRPALNNRIEQLQVYCPDMDIQPGHVLEPLTETELAAYLSYRLKAAGLSAEDSRKALSDEAVQRIFAHAQGSLRTVHLLADQALQNVCAADRYFPIQAADVPPPDGEFPKKRRQAAALSGRTLKLLAAVVLLLLAGLLFQYRDLLLRSGQKTAHEIVAPVPVKPEALLPLPDKVKLNSEPELPPEPEIVEEEPAPVSEVTATVAPTGSEPDSPTEQETPPAAELPAVSSVEQPVAPPLAEVGADLPEESLDTPPPATPIKEEPIVPKPVPVVQATPPPVVAPQKKIVELLPGMRKTKPKPKATPAPIPESVPQLQFTAPGPEQQRERAVVPAADQLYQELLTAGSLLKGSRNAGRYTIQLLNLAAPEGAAKIKELLVRDEYLELRSQLKILRSPSGLFVFHGNYNSVDEAKAALDNMPLFLRKQYHPSALPVADALRKTGN